MDQAGYLIGKPKHFVTHLGQRGFTVVDVSEGTSIFSGVTQQRRKQDPATGLDLYWGDFTPLTRPGYYQVELENGHRSYPFRIADDVYGELARMSLKSFYFQRCGVALDPAHAGRFERVVCHEHDAAYHPSLERKGGKGTGGGWHDAGDYGKYVHAAAVSLGHMLIMFEHFPESFASDATGIPESGNGIPDFLDEMQWELEWMLRMQENDPEHPLHGGVHYMVNTRDYEWMRADLDEAPRFLYEVSSVATADFAAAMALASRCFRGSAELELIGKRYLEAAERAWSFLEAHPELFPSQGFIRPSDTKTGGYADQPDLNDRDDRLWAAVELLLATGDSIYADFLRDSDDPFIRERLWEASSFDGDLEWQDVSAFALLQCALHDVGAIDPGLSAHWKSLLLKRCEQILDDVKTDGFGVALTRYYWGSSGGVMALAQYLIFGYQIDPDRVEFVEAALGQLHYLLGRNALNQSFVTGVGSQSPLYIHHASLAPGGIENMIPGLVAGGPNPSLSGDQTLPLYFDQTTPPALCYIDHIDSWASNENCILYNAPLVAVAHYFAKPQD